MEERERERDEGESGDNVPLNHDLFVSNLTRLHIKRNHYVVGGKMVQHNFSVENLFYFILIVFINFL